MWWRDGLRSHNGRVGAAAVCNHDNEWRTRHSYLGTGRMKVFDAELWAIVLMLGPIVKRSNTIQQHGVKKVAVFIDSHAPIRQAAHLETGLGQ